MKKMTVWLVSLLAPALFVCASASAQDRTAVAEELLRKSGLWNQLADFDQQVLAGLQERVTSGDSKVSSTELPRVEAAVKRAYGADRLRAVATRMVASGMDDAHLTALRKWYDSPLGQRITKLEEQPSPRDENEVVAKGVAVLQNSPRERITLLSRLMIETKVVDAMVEANISMMSAALRGVLAVSPNQSGMSEADIQQLLEAGRPEMVKQAAQYALVSFAYTYQSVSDADLKRYIGFMGSPSGRHFNELTMHALNGALLDGSEEFGRNLVLARDAANP